MQFERAAVSELKPYFREDNCVIVFTKNDLHNNNPSVWLDCRIPTISVSALTGNGIPELMAIMDEQSEKFRRGSGDETIVINARHSRSLAHAHRCIAAAQKKLTDRDPLELLASDLHEALSAFGEISGRIDNEHMLDVLFSNFCIGK